MRVFPVLAWASLTGLTGLSAPLVPASPTHGASPEPVVRTIYVTATDGNGSPVPDLTPADFIVKEGGKEREIVKAVPATMRMRLAVMAEERLLGDGGVRIGLFEFMKRLQPNAATSFITIGLRNNTVVDYTTDLNAIVAGINGLSLNPPPHSNLTEGILDIGKTIERNRPRAAGDRRGGGVWRSGGRGVFE